jgi:hypothetical protein
MKLVSWKFCLAESYSSRTTSSMSLSFSGASVGATGTTDVAGDVGVLAGGLVVPLGYGGSVVCLPPLVRTLNICSGLVATGATADNFDNFDSSLALNYLGLLRFQKNYPS